MYVGEFGSDVLMTPCGESMCALIDFLLVICISIKAFNGGISYCWRSSDCFIDLLESSKRRVNAHQRIQI